MRSVTLDIQESCIKLLATNGKRVTQWTNAPLPDGVVSDGTVRDPVSLAGHINALLKEQGSPKGKVLVCLSGVRYMPRVFTVPRVKRRLQQEAIRYESELRMPVPLDQLHLVWQWLSCDDSRDRYFVVGVNRSSIDALLETMAQAGIKNFSLDFKPAALARAITGNESVILNVEQDNADIVLVVNGVPEVMRSVPVDWDHDAKEERLEKIAMEVTRTIDYYNSTHLDRPLDATAPMFLSGSLAREASVQTLMNKFLGDKLASVEFPLRCPPDIPVEEYAANIGIAMGRNALKGRKAGAPSPAMAIGASWMGYKAPSHLGRNLYTLAVALLALALLVPLSQTASHAMIERDLLAQELVLMEEQLRDVVKINASLENLELETSRLKEERLAVLGDESGFAERLSTLMRNLPLGMTADSINMTEDSISLDGTSAHFLQVIDFTAFMKETGLFSAVYLESVAAMGTNNRNGAIAFEIRSEY